MLKNNFFTLIILLAAQFHLLGQSHREVEYPVLELAEPDLKQDFMAILDSLNCMQLDSLQPKYVLSVYAKVSEMDFENNQVKAYFVFEIVPFVLYEKYRPSFAGVLKFDNGFVFVDFSYNYFWINFKSDNHQTINFSQLLPESYKRPATRNQIFCQYELVGTRLKFNKHGCTCSDR